MNEILLPLPKFDILSDTNNYLYINYRDLINNLIELNIIITICYNML